jgi:hypothetical protein
MSDNTRYPAILFISKVIRFFAWCSLLLTVVGMIFVFFVLIRDGLIAILAVFGAGVFGGFFTLGLFAIAESLIVLIDIEYNTRKSSQLMTKIQEVDHAKRNEIKNNFPSENLDSKTNPKSQNIKIKTVSEAIRKIKDSGIDLEIVEAGATDNKYLLKKGTTVRYIYKDLELMEYAEEL